MLDVQQWARRRKNRRAIALLRKWRDEPPSTEPLPDIEPLRIGHEHDHTWVVDRVRLIHSRRVYEHWDAVLLMRCFHCPAEQRRYVYNVRVEEGGEHDQPA